MTIDTVETSQADRKIHIVKIQEYESAKAMVDADKGLMLIKDLTDGGYWVMTKYEEAVQFNSKLEEE